MQSNTDKKLSRQYSMIQSCIKKGKFTKIKKIISKIRTMIKAEVCDEFNVDMKFKVYEFIDSIESRYQI